MKNIGDSDPYREAILGSEMVWKEESEIKLRPPSDEEKGDSCMHEKAKTIQP